VVGKPVTATSASVSTAADSKKAKAEKTEAELGLYCHSVSRNIDHLHKPWPVVYSSKRQSKNEAKFTE